MSRLEQALAATAGVLADAGAEFALVGGLAVSARTEPRFTRDADLAVSVETDRIAEALVMRLGQAGYRVVTQVEQEQTGRLATVRLAPPECGDEDLVVDLLFASSGIEPEVVEQAEALRLTATLTIPVATLAHLVALKVLSRDDTARPQDRADLVALLASATPDDLATSRQALQLIEHRGYSRGRELLAAFDALVGNSGT